MNRLEKIILGSFNRINFSTGEFSAALKAFFPSVLFANLYFMTYLFRHLLTFQSGVSLARFIQRVIITGLIVSATVFQYLPPAILMGIKIGYATNILCTMLVFIIGVPLSQAKIARSLAEQVGRHHYNWFLNLFRKKVAERLKTKIEEATIIEIDSMLDGMIGPLLIAIEILGALFGALIPLWY